MVSRQFDRRKQFDERSRSFSISELLDEKLPLRSFTWRAPSFFDQGEEGACVGFSWTAELAAWPSHVDGLNDTFAKDKIYQEAKKLDDWPGEDYEGTSVLAGAKAVQELGYIDHYRWAFGADDAIRAIGYSGPVVIGINWYESMMSPRPSGLVTVEGNPVGGHAILVRGVALKAKLPGEKSPIPIVRLRNSWGQSWGKNGECYVSLEDFEKLLKDDGEVCIPVGRHSTLKPEGAK